MSRIQKYLKGQFPEFEVEWSRKIKPILDVMGNVQARYNYQHLLTPGQKSTLAILLDELVMELNSHGDELEGDFEFEWAKQSAISVGEILCIFFVFNVIGYRYNMQYHYHRV